MIKYIPQDTNITFEEIPDEVTLCINISNCQNNCKGCHSPHLKQNIGSLLDFKALDRLLKKNNGVTCLCFMGEGNDEKTLKETILLLKKFYPDLKFALYSGRKEIQDVFYWNTFDYLKIGPYDEKAGPLNSPTTNQRMYKKVPDSEGRGIIVSDRLRFNWVDVTEKFWKR